MQLSKSTVDRFWGKVRVGTPEECWPWLANRDRAGYGRFRVSVGVQICANRAAWLIACGDIPDGICVLHRCDNPPCCNPAHLWLGTHLDNAHDRDAKGRGANGTRHGWHTHPESVLRGERKPLAKLTEEAVVEIRTSRDTERSLAKKYRVSKGLIWMVKTRKIWAHVP